MQLPGFILRTGFIVLCSAAISLASSGSSKNKDTDATIPEIPYQKFVLDNGLTLIVHEDAKAPIVAVNVWYHVGSKNEKPGKTGFAHLFEHLMFNGSENFDDDYFQALERVGATDLNGTTNRDRTNYFQNVPTSALDVALWMESDRMGHLLGAINQAKLDEQRGVVQNEKRQGENQPYGRVFDMITKASFPKGHPYSWTTIGEMEDLDAASLEDVHEWFKTYYGAANAVLVIAGDVKADEVKKRVEHYFGHIPAGPPIDKHNTWVAKRTGKMRQQMQDRVNQARVYKVWNVPQLSTPAYAYLDLASDVLASGKTSRLYKRLVYDDQIATDASAFIWGGEIASNFVLMATARPGEDLAKVEKALDEELAKFLATGPTEAELKRVKTQQLASFTRGIERIGGFGGKSDILAQSEVYGGSPDAYRTRYLNWAQEATMAQIHQTAKEWLSDGVYVLEVHPFTEYKTSENTVDRSKLPDAGTPPEAKFPDLQRAKLSNGMNIILAERHSVPLVRLNLMVDAGYASDQFAAPGTASLAMNMLDEGTKTRNALQISEELASIGAQLWSGSNLDMSTVSLSALKSKLDEALDIYADVILNPSFPETDFQRLQKQQIAGIQREKVTPFSMALRVFPKLLYGENHAYGNPFTGSGTEASVQKLTRDDLVKFHQTWFRPNNATLIIVGDVTLAEIQPKLEKLFRNWKSGEAPQKNISTVTRTQAREVYLIDKPGAIQSIIFAGHIAPPKANPNEITIETMNTILGGSFTARINMNLREDKHWSYGARSVVVDARGQRPFFAYAPVQTDKTMESMIEIDKELRGITSSMPATADELNKVQVNRTLRLPGSWETINAVTSSISEIVQFGLADDYHDKYADMLKAVTLDGVNKIAKEVIHPDNLVWVVVGDREKIEPRIRELGYGEIRLIDPDGNPIE